MQASTAGVAGVGIPTAKARLQHPAAAAATAFAALEGDVPAAAASKASAIVAA